MKKFQTSPPKVGNNGGTAFVRINGKRIYLGKFGSPEAAQNYARCIAEWAISSVGPEQSSPQIGTITVKSLAVAFLDYIQQNIPSQYHTSRSAITGLLQLYSDIAVDSFTPKCLVAVQHQFTRHVDQNGKRRCRGYCNTLVRHIRAIFRWGVSQELVSPLTADALKYVPPLREGRTEAPETEPRTDVPDEIVDATLPQLLPTVAAMVQVQRLATMRPNEVCRMKVGDIDMSRKDGIWLYNLPKHKGTWRGHKKIVPLGKPEQTLILPYLEGKKPGQAVFSPKTAMLEKKIKDAKRRRTKVPPSQILLAEERAANPKRGLQEHYSSRSYARSIERAIAAANKKLPKDQQIPHWTPYQLRHAGITELIAEHDGDRDIARAVAGQKSINITQGYNHADLRIAIEQAKKRGNSPENPPEGQLEK
jgi:integrase